MPDRSRRAASVRADQPGFALGDGIAVDDILVGGSPGMRVEHAGDPNTGTAHTWSTAADDNFVARTENNAWCRGPPHGSDGALSSGSARTMAVTRYPDHSDTDARYRPRPSSQALSSPSRSESGHGRRGSRTLTSDARAGPAVGYPLRRARRRIIAYASPAPAIHGAATRMGSSGWCTTSARFCPRRERSP
jgi:Alpha/beta hydrolase